MHLLVKRILNVIKTHGTTMKKMQVGCSSEVIVTSCNKSMCHNPENNCNLHCNNILKSHILNNNANAKLEALSLDTGVNEDSNVLESYAVSIDRQYKFQSTRVPPDSRSSSRMSGESSSSSPSTSFYSPSCDKSIAS